MSGVNATFSDPLDADNMREYDGIYQTYTTPTINYNHGYRTTTKQLEGDETGEMREAQLKDLMNEDRRVSKIERELESNRRTSGLQHYSTNELDNTRTLGTGKCKGSAKGRGGGGAKKGRPRLKLRFTK